MAFWNSVAFVVAACVLRGDAPNGRVETGTTASCGTDISRAVSRTVFQYDLWRTYVLWINVAVVMALNVLVRLTPVRTTHGEIQQTSRQD